MSDARDPAVRLRVSVPLTTGERQFFDCFGITPDSLRLAISRYWQEVGPDRPRSAAMTSSGSAFNYPVGAMPPSWSDGWGAYRIADVATGCGWNPFEPEDYGGYYVGQRLVLIELGTPTEDCWVTVSWEWFQYDDPNGNWEDPEAGGTPDSGGGGYSSASPASAWQDTSTIALVTDSFLTLDDTPDFNCITTRCPPAKVIRDSPAVDSATKALLILSLRDSVEYGAWLYLNANGTIRVGPAIAGTIVSVPGLNANLTPTDAIGSLHTHWYPPARPSPWDDGVAGESHSYVVVGSAGWIYVRGPDGTLEYRQRRTGGI